MRQLFGWGIGILLVLAGCKKPDMTVAPAPGTVAVSTTLNYLNNNFDFSLFAEAITRSGLDDSLSSQDRLYTVLAIANKGMNKLGVNEPRDFEKWSVDSLRRFVKTHLLPGRIAYGDIPRSLDTKYNNLNGDDLYVSVFQTAVTTKLTVNGVEVAPVSLLNAPSGADPAYGISLLNGMVYPVNAAIKASPENIQAFLASRKDMTIFVAGLKKFGLWEAIKERTPITVLAPPDSVFLRYGITLDSIGKMDMVHYKKAFMEAYVIGLNRIFTSDIYSLINREKVPEIPFIATVPLLTLPAGDPDLVLSMLGYSESASLGFGCFVFDRTKLVTMTDESGGAYWYYQILGVNATNYPQYGDINSGYQIAYAGEWNRAGNFQGTYINYSFANGVVHLLSGLLLTPDDVKK